MKDSTIPQARKELAKILLKLKDEKEAANFLEDILTPQELDTVSERWQIVKRLFRELPQRKIAEELELGIATVTRGSRAIQYGTGFLKVLWERAK